MRKNRDDKNLVEAVGDSYTNFNAISVFSGVPTVVGWRVHEWLWRGSYTPVGIRDGEAKEFYENNDNKKTVDFISKYNVGWIVVGEDERSRYKVNEVKLRKLGDMVIKDGVTYLIKVR